MQLFVVRAPGRSEWHEHGWEVIGRDDELGSIEAFLVGSRRPGGARPLRRGGHRQDDPLGGGRRGGRAAASVASCRAAASRPRRRSRSPASPICSHDVLDEVAPSLAPLRRRALEVALLLAEPGEAPPDPHAIGLAVLDVLRALAERDRCSSRSTTSSGSTRRPPACSRSRSGACATSLSACSRPCGRARRRERRSSSTRVFRRSS